MYNSQEENSSRRSRTSQAATGNWCHNKTRYPVRGKSEERVRESGPGKESPPLDSARGQGSNLGPREGSGNSPLRYVYLDKCEVCGDVATKKCGCCENAFYCSELHQEKDWGRHKSDCNLWTFQETDHWGNNKYLIARRDIPPGKVLITEYPIMTYINPDTEENDMHNVMTSTIGGHAYRCLGCEVAIVNLKHPHRCSKCKIPLCSAACETSFLHLRECCALQQMGMVETRKIREIRRIYEDVIILRLFLPNCSFPDDDAATPVAEHSTNGYFRETPTLKKVFSLSCHHRAQACRRAIESFLLEPCNASQMRNAFPLSLRWAGNNTKLIILLYSCVKSLSCYTNTTVGRKALYGKLQNLTHNCVPNTDVLIDDSFYHRLTIRSRVFIRAGQPITCDINISLFLQDTLRRREILRKSFIDCQCPRCLDPTELGTFYSSPRCNKCHNGYLISLNSLNRDVQWRCKACRTVLSASSISNMNASVTEELENIMADNIKSKEDLISVCENLQRFLTRTKGNLLHPNHRLVQEATSKLSQNVAHFTGTGAKLVLCVVAQYPRASLYASCQLDESIMMFEFYEKVRPGICIEKGKLMYEIACVQFALALDNYRKGYITELSYIQELMEILHWLDRSGEILTLYPERFTSPWFEDARSLSKLIKGVHGELLEPLSDDLSYLPEVIDHLLCVWNKKAKALQLDKIYNKPSLVGNRTICNFAELLKATYWDD